MLIAKQINRVLYGLYRQSCNLRKPLRVSRFHHTLIIFISNIQHKGDGMVSWKSVGIYKILIKQRVTYINMRTRTVTDDCKYCPSINFALIFNITSTKIKSRQKLCLPHFLSSVRHISEHDPLSWGKSSIKLFLKSVELSTVSWPEILASGNIYKR